MKKLLFLVLFVLILSSITADAADEWNKVKNVVKDAVKWLKEKGIYDKLLDLLKTAGEKAAIELCSKKLPKFLCKEIVEWLVNAIKKNLIKN